MCWSSTTGVFSAHAFSALLHTHTHGGCQEAASCITPHAGGPHMRLCACACRRAPCAMCACMHACAVGPRMCPPAVVHLQVRAFFGHEGEVLRVGWSQNGMLLVSGGWLAAAVACSQSLTCMHCTPPRGMVGRPPTPHSPAGPITLHPRLFVLKLHVMWHLPACLQHAIA